MKAITEQALCFDCEGERLIGVLAAPADSAAAVGVVIAVGGPQVRVGSHRQFLLLSRRLAGAGHAVLRFDVRGMGDATGDFPGFESLGPDLAAAVAALRQAVPGVARVVLWGLCDAASAALIHGPSLQGVDGMVLLNPWARHADTVVRTQVKHYYAKRALDRAFWQKLLTGRVNILRSTGELAGKLWHMLSRRLRATATGATVSADLPLDYRERMARGALRFHGPQLYILSGRDHVCAEFLDYARDHAGLARLWERATVQRLDMPQADHTFSSARWRGEVEAATLQWLQQLTHARGPA